MYASKLINLPKLLIKGTVDIYWNRATFRFVSRTTAMLKANPLVKRHLYNFMLFKMNLY